MHYLWPFAIIGAVALTLSLFGSIMMLAFMLFGCVDLLFASPR